MITELEAIFVKHFMVNMIRKDFKAFKGNYPTLWQVILRSMEDASKIKQSKELTLTYSNGEVKPAADGK